MKHGVSNTNAIGSTKHNFEEPHGGKMLIKDPLPCHGNASCLLQRSHILIRVAKKIAMFLLKINHIIFCCIQRKMAALCRTYKQHNQAHYLGQ